MEILHEAIEVRIWIGGHEIEPFDPAILTSAGAAGRALEATLTLEIADDGAFFEALSWWLCYEPIALERWADDGGRA